MTSRKSYKVYGFMSVWRGADDITFNFSKAFKGKLMHGHILEHLNVWHVTRRGEGKIVTIIGMLESALLLSFVSYSWDPNMRISHSGWFHVKLNGTPLEAFVVLVPLSIFVIPSGSSVCMFGEKKQFKRLFFIWRNWLRFFCGFYWI